MLSYGKTTTPFYNDRLLQSTTRITICRTSIPVQRTNNRLLRNITRNKPCMDICGHLHNNHDRNICIKLQVRKKQKRKTISRILGKKILRNNSSIIPLIVYNNLLVRTKPYTNTITDNKSNNSNIPTSSNNRSRNRNTKEKILNY